MNKNIELEKDIPYVDFLPTHWQLIPNKYLFKYSGKKVGKDFSNYQLLSLTTSGVKPKDINSAGGKVPESYENYQTVKKGQIVFCLFDLDCSAVFSGLSKYNGMITSAYDVFTTTNKINNRYADYWFMYVFSNRYYKLFSKNIRYTVTSDIFGSLKTPIPSSEEQIKIADFLDKKCNQIDTLISLEQKEIEKLKEYKQSKINVVVSKGLVKTNIMEESGIEWIGQFPTGWNITRLKYIGKLSGGISSLKPENFGFGYPFVNYKNIYKNYVLDQNFEEKANTTLEERKKYNIKYGDLFFTGSSETIDELGYSCVALSDFPNAVYNGFCIRMRPYSFVNYNPKYFLYLTRSHICRNFLSANDNSITRANLSQSRLGGMPIIFPNLKEQERSVEYLDNLCQKVEDLILIKQSKIEELQNYKKSLIYEYVTGKKRCI